MGREKFFARDPLSERFLCTRDRLKTACDRLDSLFIPVSPIWRRVLPSWRSRITSSVEATFTSRSPDHSILPLSSRMVTGVL
jgi:hypothetical protein